MGRRVYFLRFMLRNLRMEFAPIAASSARWFADDTSIIQPGCNAGPRAAKMVALVYLARIRVRHAAGYYQPVNSGCSSGSVALGSAIVYLPIKLCFHISEN